MVKELHFAPLQGYTLFAYRRAHARLVGGVTAYYSPFIRWEKGSIRRKDLIDVLPEHNADVPLVPQIIAGTQDEFDRLCDAVQELGHTRIDLNMGCPAPMQTRLRRGSALVGCPFFMEQIAELMKQRADITFSVKMRLGWQEKNEWRNVLPILHDLPLSHITLHPRIGTQQYKGLPDMEAFAAFYEECRHPLIYNGDLTTLEEVARIEMNFPRLRGIMMGRGLLGKPFLSAEHTAGEAWDNRRRAEVVLRIHDEWLAFCREKYVSDAQVLLQVKPFWEYQNLWLDRKIWKKIMKAGSVRNYTDAVATVRRIPF